MSIQIITCLFVLIFFPDKFSFERIKLTRHCGRWGWECRSSSCPGRGCRCRRVWGGSGASTRAPGSRAETGGDCLAGGGNPATLFHCREQQNTRVYLFRYDTCYGMFFFWSALKMLKMEKIPSTKWKFRLKLHISL